MQNRQIDIVNLLEKLDAYLGKNDYDAAKKHLYQNNGKQSTYHNDPVRNGNRTHKSQQNTGNHRRKVIDLAVLLHDLAPGPLEKYTGCHADERHDQCPQAEEIDAADQRRHQGNDHIPHNGTGSGLGMYVG